MYTYLTEKLRHCAQRNGQRLLNITHNPISCGKLMMKSLQFGWLVRHVDAVLIVCVDRKIDGWVGG